jgi:hypothetical protein
MIAYGRLIDTWVEISTLSETNNAQFFSEPESCALFRESTSRTCGTANNAGRIFGSP